MITPIEVQFGIGRIAMSNVQFSNRTVGMLLRDSGRPNEINKPQPATDEDFEPRAGDILLSFANSKSIKSMMSGLTSLLAILEDEEQMAKETKTPEEAPKPVYSLDTKKDWPKPTAEWICCKQSLPSTEQFVYIKIGKVVSKASLFVSSDNNTPYWLTDDGHFLDVSADNLWQYIPGAATNPEAKCWPKPLSNG